MYTDPAYGFAVWDSMLRGAPFNTITMPDLADIARDRNEFLAYWSPAQYLFAGPLEWAGLGLGAATNVVTTVFTALGLVGWYRFYRSWNFPVASAAVALAITAGNRYFALPFGIYSGGEILQFGAMPWFLLLLGRWSALQRSEAVLVLAAIVGIAFFKLSGGLFALCALAAVVVWDLLPITRISWRRPLTALGIAIAFGAALYFGWISRGETAIQARGAANWGALVPSFIEGWAASVMGMFSLGDLVARLVQQPGRQLLHSLDAIYLVAAVPALLLLGWSARRLRDTHADYLRFAGAVAFFYIAALAVIYGKGGQIIMEDRYYRPLALILLVGIVQAVVTSRPTIRLPLGALAAAMMVYGISSYVVRLQHNRHVPIGARAFHQGTLTHDGLALMKRELAGADRNTVAWVMMPEIALEARPARVVVNAGVEGLLGIRKYKGRAGRVLVFVDNNMVQDGRIQIVLKSFVDYDPSKWVATTLGDSTVFTQ